MGDINETILNSIRDQICLIDKNGEIIFVNEQWNQSVIKNRGDLCSCGLGANYIHASRDNTEVHKGLISLMNDKIDVFTHEYDCHIGNVKKWFLMKATKLKRNDEGIEGAVICHVNITKQKLFERQLKKYADTDPLTSLYNRRFFEEKLQECARQLHVDDNPVAIIYMDIDNFKDINDAFGHAAGDNVLKELSFLLLEVTKEDDICARWGGDEFALLLLDANKNDLTVTAKRILQHVQRLKVPVDSTTINVYVSIGGGFFSESMKVDEMLEKVDVALYEAKDKGKNQICIRKE
ncbi:GGDEF domain-containing protein [Bacillus shivajii]|uniref:sensor domain-containing diguanylate cyclase n=1 Tax=Bacillus shivajii TaxID=1983719 RepID=UPI001CFA256B|nr:GGDEF domain-containing protein [Bacillus shivajii]UCZ54080.1 GGDEF domain-containing protein [Bacillus shivajii]